jgi:hypothetical protein
VLIQVHDETALASSLHSPFQIMPSILKRSGLMVVSFVEDVGKYLLNGCLASPNWFYENLEFLDKLWNLRACLCVVPKDPIFRVRIFLPFEGHSKPLNLAVSLKESRWSFRYFIVQYNNNRRTALQEGNISPFRHSPRILRLVVAAHYFSWEAFRGKQYRQRIY